MKNKKTHCGNTNRRTQAASNQQRPAKLTTNRPPDRPRTGQAKEKRRRKTR